jgi:hypothetical protein
MDKWLEWFALQDNSVVCSSCVDGTSRITQEISTGHSDKNIRENVCSMKSLFSFLLGCHNY